MAHTSSLRRRLTDLQTGATSRYSLLTRTQRVILLASIVMVAIRAPHGQRSRAIPVVRSRKGPLEIILLTIAWIAFFLTLIWIVTR